MSFVPFQQRTLAQNVRFDGIGLHSGKTVHVEIRPAAANTGIVFQRTDIPGKPYIKATPSAVFDTSLATRIGSPEVSVSTIEHLMGAFFALGIDNAVVALDSFELPILDGSALPFLILLDEAGTTSLKKPKKAFVVTKRVEVLDPKNPDRFILVEPSKTPQVSYAINFERAEAIGKQAINMSMTGEAYCREVAFARTFCLESDIAFMHARGLAKGGSLENAIVVSPEAGVTNRMGLRSPDEFVRHKALDCVGDLFLLGMPIVGHIIAHKAGHDLHTQLAKKLEAELAQHKIVEPQQRELVSFAKLFGFVENLSVAPNSISLASIRG
jgi:UDP-3-O-[3-hydroxymyristoyl] N-acetylglucosamine deacetylase